MKYPLEIVGLVLTCSNAFACIQIHLDALGCIWALSENFGNFRRGKIEQPIGEKSEGAHLKTDGCSRGPGGLGPEKLHPPHQLRNCCNFFGLRMGGGVFFNRPWLCNGLGMVWPRLGQYCGASRRAHMCHYSSDTLRRNAGRHSGILFFSFVV